ncbi:RNA dependent RNA polymerase [Diatom colony associated dsRNA virus 9 genome type A]|uniref:RNA dependent RNA polymerase n=1 Tax=Diatom colony associated dsRNA virus 9 genome type A TaxID=1678168 RepID=UPI0007A66B5F|nr:RNA dependent RNA polymerase [Diatom colony associated dsRNA virus 9 genome type A]BAU79500.1 RNA dependent RNA polymerase [Diatom colony associated dsRNA virus 9 genome type A]
MMRPTPSLVSQLRKRKGANLPLREALTVQRLADEFLEVGEALELSQSTYKVPIQNSIDTKSIIGSFLSVEVENLELPDPAIAPSLLDSKDDRDVFPLKENPQAKTKVNVFFRDVWTSIKKYFPRQATFLSKNVDLLLGMNNDEASAWVIWFTGVSEIDFWAARELLKIAKDYERLSELSDLLKTSGRGDCLLGRCCFEMRVLAGRGASPPDPAKDVRTRIDKKAFEAEKSCGVGSEIRKYVREVLNNEMVRRPNWETTKSYWKKRWLYTKSGSHARRIEKHMFDKKLDLPPQPTRREFSEAVKECVVATGLPSTHAGQSWKLEHFKTRAIYSGDTRSYFTFDYLLRPVEAVWANKTCLLDPGNRGQMEMFSELSSHGDVNFMLDFEDFNAQHTKEAMKVVIEEACAGAPEDVVKWALESFDNEFVYWMEDGVEKCALTIGGLFSGHRATTFLNTVLNEAYCRMAMGDVYRRLKCKHAGDDVIVQGTDVDIDIAVSRFMESPFRANPSKQGLGRMCGEFLRTSFTKKEAGGYFARAVSSLVSGNWVSDSTNTELEAAQNYASMSWTLAVRSQVLNIGAVLTDTILRRVPSIAPYAFAVATCGVSVGGTPVFGSAKGQVLMLDIVSKSIREREVDFSKSYATDDFINSQIDEKMLEMAGITRAQLRRAMLEASTKPRIESNDESPAGVLCLKAPVADMVDIVVAKSNVVRQATNDTIAAQKVLSSLYGRIDWDKVFSVITGNRAPLLPELSQVTWPVVNRGNMSFSELAKTKNDLVRSACVTTMYPILV